MARQARDDTKPWLVTRRDGIADEGLKAAKIANCPYFSAGSDADTATRVSVGQCLCTRLGPILICSG